MYVRVYAPNGEPFDVSRDRADILILNSGWTQTPPMPAPELDDILSVEDGADSVAMIEAPRPRRRRTVADTTDA